MNQCMWMFVYNDSSLVVCCFSSGGSGRENESAAAWIRISHCKLPSLFTVLLAASRPELRSADFNSI